MMSQPNTRAASLQSKSPMTALLVGALAALPLSAAITTAAITAQEQTADLDATRMQTVIGTTLELLRDKYVFPDVALEMSGLVEKKLADGKYDSIRSGSELAIALTSDFQSISHDLHLRVSFAKSVSVFDESEDPEKNAMRKSLAAHQNFGFESVQRLNCNVGYVDLRNFHEAGAGRATAIAAMNFLANTDALIFDLRKNGGGDPGMVALLSSYLFGSDPVHLNSLYWREGETTEEYWTDPGVPGRTGDGKPVFVLTSGRTFSAAEEFTYNLQCLGRAMIVGETTGGGAHPGGSVPVDEQFSVWIPMGRAINPITGTNWEGTGVKPDVDVPARVALEMAHMLSIETLLANATEEWRVKDLQNELEQVRGRIDELASNR